METINENSHAPTGLDKQNGVIIHRGPRGPKGDIGPRGPKGDIGPMGPKGDIGPSLRGPRGTEIPEIGYQNIILRTTLLIFLLIGIILIIFGIHEIYLVANPTKIGYIYTIIGATILFIREYIYYYYYVDKYKTLI